MLTADALADLIAANTRMNHLWEDFSGSILVDDLVDAVADALEAEYACTCNRKELPDLEEHYRNCPSDTGEDELFVKADWVSRAKGEG